MSLAGPVAASFSSQQENEATLAVATAYLKAAGVHLSADSSSVFGGPEEEMIKTKQQADVLSVRTLTSHDIWFFTF